MDESMRGTLLRTLDTEEQLVSPVYDRIEWHCDACRARHGVVRNVTRADIPLVERMLAYYFGAYRSHGLWWVRNPDGMWSVEFNHQTKTSPPPHKPWEWCGGTVLFADWQAHVATVRQASRRFDLGTPVTFQGKGATHQGIVVGGGPTCAKVLVGNVAWRVTWTLLSSVPAQP